MTSFTAPSDLFREIGQIHDLIGELARSERTAILHWPTYYLLYVDIDRIGWDLGSVGRCMTAPLAGHTQRDDADMAEAAASCCASLHKRVKSIVNFLQRWASHSMLVKIGDDDLKHRLHSHFRLKSAWRDLFLERYCAGRIAPDGMTFERTVLLLDPQPSYRMQDVHERELLHHQRFDLTSTPAALADAVTRVQRQVGDAQAAMMRRFAGQCRIEDLLHPSSL